MNRTTLKTYAPQARRDFITAVTDRAAYYGLTRDRIETMTEQGDVVIIAGTSLSRHVAAKRKRLEERITRQGFEHTMEAMAYTWFNRFAAIRFMELHGYLEHGYRVLSHSDPDKPTPEILEHAEHVDLPGLNQTTVIDLKLDGTREAELYRLLLMAQCNALHASMPFLFERIDDETELLLPDNLLHSDSLIRKLVNGIDEEDWQEVEIIGWLYQFYISEKKDQVIGKVVKSEDIPAATQLFTPNWIVKYLVQNSLGRQWIATYPDSPLKQQMAYYIEPAEQTPEVQTQLKAITPESLNPEELTLLDPACGSGHILVEAYDLFKTIYQERGYRARDIPALILQKNLYGLEIDDRAAQLAAFALMMKARADDRRIFANGVQPHVLAIQESKGLNAQQITEALNIPILKTERLPSEYLFEELEEERAPLFSRKNLAVKGDIAQTDVAQLITLFEHGKTFGSLIRVPENVAEKLPTIAQRVEEVLVNGGMLEQAAAKSFSPLIEQSQHLAQKYNCVVANPPYMGAKYCNALLKNFLRDRYKGLDKDLFSAFVTRNKRLTKPDGHLGFMMPFVWMFISSHETLRELILHEAAITSLIQLEYSGFTEATVPICTFTLQNEVLQDYTGSYIRLTTFRGAENQAPKTLEAIQNHNCGWFYTARQSDFRSIPGQPIAYWISERMRQCFQEGTPLGEIALARHGMTTSDTNRFLRRWSEVSTLKIGQRMPDRAEAKASMKKWFPYNKGGEYRRWYGNNEWLVNWENDGEELFDLARKIYGSPTRTISNGQFYFRPALTWSLISSSFFAVRCSDQGFLFDVGGSSAFPPDEWRECIAGFLCSSIAFDMLKVLNPTMNFPAGSVAGLPILQPQLLSRKSAIDTVVHEAVQLARTDWDSFETSWDFQTLPVLQQKATTLSQSQAVADAEVHARFQHMKQLEEENNRLFIDAYSLQDELSPEVADDQITLYRPNREEDIKRLLSYAIGCMMGRYSLDKPGLIYAHSANKNFDPSQYHTFPADDDGIIPMMETDWFPDDASNRLVEFISVAWPKEHLEENLTFIADSLGPNRNEQPRDTIRRYLATGFYKHHLSMYKRRPIYWLFSSGKQRAFQCLVYLHRYHEGTLARMRTEYVIPLQGKIASRLDQLADDIAAASSTAHRKRLEKERETLRKQHTELQAFDEQLRHYADQRISLDLDDGVKVNYGKFGDLLAEVKAVTGGTMDDAP
jgi:type II restriction/modification system DNA methylase subunit YeeA